MEPDHELYVDNDSETHPLAGKALREFLPSVFEGKYDPKSEPEMEWVSIPPFHTQGPTPDDGFRLVLRATPRLETRLYVYSTFYDILSCNTFRQVGPVEDLIIADIQKDQYKGQYIAAGYTGHGMPRSFGW